MSNSTATLNQLLWEGQKTTPQDFTFWTTIGVVLTALLLSSIITFTVRYFEHFNRSDHILVRIAIGAGTLVCVGLLGLQCSAVYNLINHAAVDYGSILKQDTYTMLVFTLITMFYAFPAWLFYAYRSWKLLGRNYFFMALTIPLSVVPVLLIFVMCVYGFRCPQVTLSNFEAVVKWLDTVNNWVKIAAIATMVNDAWLCAALIVGLHRSKRSFLDMESSLLARLTRLAFETMLPPGILLLMTISSLSVDTSAASNFRRATPFSFPLVYYHCLLYCLVCRQTVRELMDRRLGAIGVEMLSASDEGQRPTNGGVYVSRVQHVHREDAESVKASELSSAEVFACTPTSTENRGDWTADV